MNHFIRRNFWIMIVTVIMISDLMANLAAAQENPTGVLPSAKAIVTPFTWVENFPTGTNQITENHLAALRQIQTYLTQHPQDVAVLIGLVSDLQIRGTCYVNYDTGYFSLHQNQSSCTVLNGNRPCQEALALSRSIAIRNWLLANGIEQNRVRILNFNAVGLKTGGNYPNQAVAVWIITFDHVGHDNGGLVYIPCQPCQSGQSGPAPTNALPRRRGGVRIIERDIKK